MGDSCVLSRQGVPGASEPHPRWSLAQSHRTSWRFQTHPICKLNEAGTRKLWAPGPPSRLNQVLLPNGTVSGSPEDVVAEITRYFTALQTPDKEVESTLPWEGDLDPMKITSKGTPSPLGNCVTRELRPRPEPRQGGDSCKHCYTCNLLNFKVPIEHRVRPIQGILPGVQ